jgi:hypothetical protein
MKITLTIILVIIIGFLGFQWFGQSSDNSPESTTEATTDTSPANGSETPRYILSGSLEDVTEGKEVRGIKTLPSTTGTVQAGFAGETFIMEAIFSDLPEPQGDDFYEGWLVRKGLRFSVVSTGKLTDEGDGAYSNLFTSEEDLLDHDFYVLTIEPNDGDPAPADHILEGDLSE